jgi:hypothetical protein
MPLPDAYEAATAPNVKMATLPHNGGDRPTVSVLCVMVTIWRKYVVMDMQRQ